MSSDIERQRELSKRVLMQGEPKPAGQRTPRQVQITPKQLAYHFMLGSIVGLSLLVVIWISSGFSKLAIMLPFIGGISSIAIKKVLQKNKT